MASDLLRVEGAEQLRRLSRDLRKLELDERQEIRRLTVRELKGVADEIVRAEKAAVLALPSREENRRRRRRGLRRRMASATMSRVRTAAKAPEVSVLINPKRLNPQMARLPAYMNAEPDVGPWRHPTFGRDPWITQRPMPWWDRTARPYEAIAQQRLIAVIEHMRQQIERG